MPWANILLRYVLPALAVIGLCWWGYDTVYDRGYAACQAEAAAVASKVENRNDTAASQAGSALNEELGQKLPAAEEAAHESVERIRTVYIDRPVPAGCAWSGGVLDELEAGRAAANRAVRSGSGSSDTADPAQSR